MADLIFDLKQMKLSLSTKGMDWNAISGPFGMGVFLSCLYDMGRREVEPHFGQVDAEYCQLLRSLFSEARL